MCGAGVLPELDNAQHDGAAGYSTGHNVLVVHMQHITGGTVVWPH